MTESFQIADLKLNELIPLVVKEESVIADFFNERGHKSTELPADHLAAIFLTIAGEEPVTLQSIVTGFAVSASELNDILGIDPEDLQKRLHEKGAKAKEPIIKAGSQSLRNDYQAAIAKHKAIYKIVAELNLEDKSAVSEAEKHLKKFDIEASRAWTIKQRITLIKGFLIDGEKKETVAEKLVKTPNAVSQALYHMGLTKKGMQNAIQLLKEEPTTADMLIASGSTPEDGPQSLS